MIFLAHIRPGSLIDRNWRAAGRLGGMVSGVVFKKRDNRFVADELSTEQVAELQAIPSVQLECMGTAPGGDIAGAFAALPPARRPKKGSDAK